MKCISVLLLAGILFSGCNNNNVPDVQSYPFKTGSVWAYQASISEYNFRPLVSGIAFRETTFYWSARVEVLGEVMLQDSVHTWELRSTENFNSSSSAGINYYTQRNDSLYLFAYSGGSSLPMPKQPLQVRYRLMNRSYGSVRELLSLSDENFVRSSSTVSDSVIVETPSPKTLVFPLKEGLSWTYREHGHPFFIGKKITGTESVTTPAGSFSTYNLQWSWDMDENGVIDTNITGTDNITDKGLVKRSIVIRNLALVTEVDPETPVAYIDVKEEYSVTSVSQ